MWTYPPAVGEAATSIFLRPAWGLYGAIQGDKFKHIDFSWLHFLPRVRWQITVSNNGAQHVLI
jgi:hypothetical protein